MVENRIIEAINFMEKRLEKNGVNVSRIILFGSHATGAATAESDVDIIIVSADFEGKDMLERARMTKEAEISAIRKFMVSFDIITKTDAELANEDSLISEYAKNGECVYGG
ncbi:MAG: nucleotidyltransferase domain-containing protein [Deltaproteobacteria bacterium]|nr:nucleotidyltransferase domain-containing protein [Deltaproteobacteria bacterium]